MADLEREHERGQRVDAAEAAQAGDGLCPLALESEPREPLIECLLARDQPVDGGERVEVGELGRRLVEALPVEPGTVPLRPGAALVDHAVQQQQLGGAVAATHQIGAHLLARTRQVPRGLERRQGTATSLSWPASNSRANSSASLRSLLIRSPGARGVLDGATTSTRSPACSAARQSANPVGPAS